MLKFPDGSTRIVCQGLGRARLVAIEPTEPFLIGRVEPMEEVAEPMTRSWTRWSTSSAACSAG